MQIERQKIDAHATKTVQYNLKMYLYDIKLLVLTFFLCLHNVRNFWNKTVSDINDSVGFVLSILADLHKSGS